MDQHLYDLLKSHDWEGEIIPKLTLAALHQLKLCGWSRDVEGNKFTPSGTHPQGYALDAMTKAFDGCRTGTNKWDPNRGDLYPFMEQLVRRLVVNDKRKYSKGLEVFYDDLEVEPEREVVSEEHINAIYDDADSDVQELLLVLREQVDTDGDVSWTDVRKALEITEYELNKRRAKLAKLFEKHDLFKRLAKNR